MLVCNQQELYGECGESRKKHTDASLEFVVGFFFSLKFLFPDAADKLADGFESRTSTSAGNNPPPENEDYVSLTDTHEREKAILSVCSYGLHCGCPMSCNRSFFWEMKLA